jgi:hypothetical protein
MINQNFDLELQKFHKHENKQNYLLISSMHRRFPEWLALKNAAQTIATLKFAGVMGFR